MFVLGPAHLDPDKQSLTIGIRSVTLQYKPYLALPLVVENRRHMVDREQLLDGTFALRKAERQRR
jgi:DNA-binding response OmpR family regulator